MEECLIKKIIWTALICTVVILEVTGCGNKSKEKGDNLKATYNKISEYFGSETVDRTNLASMYLDEKNNVVVVELIDNEKDKQEEFVKKVNVNSKYIQFQKGGPYTTSILDFYISKSEVHNDIRYHEYYKENDRRIYLAGSVDEFYLIDNGVKETLNQSLSKEPQTLDDRIQKITDKLEKKDVLKDGGTTIYQSKAKDITMIVYNTIDKNKDVFIGGYTMNFDNASMCK